MAGEVYTEAELAALDRAIDVEPRVASVIRKVNTLLKGLTELNEQLKTERDQARAELAALEAEQRRN